MLETTGTDLFEQDIAEMYQGVRILRVPRKRFLERSSSIRVLACVTSKAYEFEVSKETNISEQPGQTLCLVDQPLLVLHTILEAVQRIALAHTLLGFKVPNKTYVHK